MKVFCIIISWPFLLCQLYKVGSGLKVGMIQHYYPQSAKSKLPIQATPPLQDKNQLSLSFTNLLEDFKNDDGDVKSIKLAKEMISYNKNEMQIKIEDIYTHNQFLSDKISNDYYGMYNSISSAFQDFMAENVDSLIGKKYFFQIDLDYDLKKADICWTFSGRSSLQPRWTNIWKTWLVFCCHAIVYLFMNVLPR